MTATKLCIRNAGPADADTIVRFNLALAAESEQRTLSVDAVARGVRSLLADSSSGVYYVAERAGSVIGQLLVTFEFSDWRDGVFWWIQSAYVVPEYRGQGVFRALFAHVLDEACRSGRACGLRLYVDRRNVGARRVYERLGLRPTEYLVYELDWTGRA